MMNHPLPTIESLSRPVDFAAIGTSGQHRISRRGARPLVFAGSQLAMAMSFTPGLPYWYEINIFRTNDQRFVLVIKLFHVSEDQRDSVDAWSFDTLAQVFDALEKYDAGRDVAVDLDGIHAGLPPGDLAVRAWELKARIEAARQHFLGLAGELLAEIDVVADAA